MLALSHPLGEVIEPVTPKSAARPALLAVSRSRLVESLNAGWTATTTTMYTASPAE
jgi:hypothetical protein